MSKLVVHLFNVPHPTIAQNTHHALTMLPDLPKIKVALFSFKPYKALGPDGLHSIFFQTYWLQTFHHIFHLVHQAFSTCKIPEELNKTFITLIPKKPNIEYISDYRPISLCNTSYKIITKILTNRIQSLLPSIISQEQAAFLPLRRTTNNIIIAQEALQFVNRTKTRTNHNFILKIDMLID